MSIPFIILEILVVITNVVMIAAILLQKKNASSGFGGAMTGMGGGDSYWSSNKGRSTEGQLAKWTKIAAALSFIFILASNLIK